MKRYFPLVVFVLSSAACFAVETPPRLFFSDAKLSVAVPAPWDISAEFPYGPLLSRKTDEGTEAYILCQVSRPVDSAKLSVDTSSEVLKAFGEKDIAARPGHPRILASMPRNLAGQNAFEITWLTEDPQETSQYQSIYFFRDDRFYDLTLQSDRGSFPWVVQSFQDWLESLRFLSRQNSGKLESPAHGGLWVHQTGGAKIAIPEDWLIGVADDRQLGATLARDKMHVDFTAALEVSSGGASMMGPEEKKEARLALTKKGWSVLSESDEPFHSYPAYALSYEGTVEGRFIRGEDLWVHTPKARWLISLEGDARLLRQRQEEWQRILNGIHFYD